MKIDVTRLAARESQRYPYTHRVEMSGADHDMAGAIGWLRECEIPHRVIGWRVIYLREDGVTQLILRWT